ncbi:endolytic transglycosylase MltG [Candidatus Daviesbacteria bacterium]|nr:endolytic transglycosylase MltG [Candidatus Daviesbacteria bacterium]
MKKILIPLIILLLLIISLIGWWNSNLAPVSQERAEKTVLIEKGKSLSEIAKILKEEGLIKSELIFSLYTRQQGLGNKLSAGVFKLSPAMSTPEIIKALTGRPAEAWVTLIEGWRIEEMAEELNSKLQIPNDKFLEVAKEGYMFPDTYLFAPDATAEQIVKKLRNTFDLRFSEELRAKIRAQGLTEEQGVILASIVEREARSDKARTEIASILLKRLQIGMGLNADATLQYILGYQEDEKSWWTKHLTREDKKIDSPYNTYLYKGLPLSPICNPGLSSLEAVANADPNTPYLYYYHDSKGNSYYAKTLEEHNTNVANNP